jgi:hypothetical protein
LGLLYWGFLKRITRLSVQAKKLDQQVLNEPFFTKKPVDQGTRFGLSISSGIIKKT